MVCEIRRLRLTEYGAWVQKSNGSLDGIASAQDPNHKIRYHHQPEVKKEIYEEYRDGKTRKELAEKHSMTEKQITMIIAWYAKRNGLPSVIAGR